MAATDDDEPDLRTTLSHQIREFFDQVRRANVIQLDDLVSPTTVAGRQVGRVPVALLVMELLHRNEPPASAREPLPADIYRLLNEAHLFYGQGLGPGELLLQPPYAPPFGPSPFWHEGFKQGNGTMVVRRFMVSPQMGEEFRALALRELVTALACNPLAPQNLVIEEVAISTYRLTKAHWHFYPVPHWDPDQVEPPLSHAHLTDPLALYVPHDEAEAQRGERRMMDLFWASPLQRCRARLQFGVDPQLRHPLVVETWAQTVLEQVFKPPPAHSALHTTKAIDTFLMPLSNAMGMLAHETQHPFGQEHMQLVQEAMSRHHHGQRNPGDLYVIVVRDKMHVGPLATEAARAFRRAAFAFILDMARTLYYPLIWTMQEWPDEVARNHLLPEDPHLWGLTPVPALGCVASGRPMSPQFAGTQTLFWVPRGPRHTKQPLQEPGLPADFYPSLGAAIADGAKPFIDLDKDDDDGGGGDGDIAV